MVTPESDTAEAVTLLLGGHAVGTARRASRCITFVGDQLALLASQASTRQ